MCQIAIRYLGPRVTEQSICNITGCSIWPLDLQLWRHFQPFFFSILLYIRVYMLDKNPHLSLYHFNMYDRHLWVCIHTWCTYVCKIHWTFMLFIFIIYVYMITMHFMYRSISMFTIKKKKFYSKYIFLFQLNEIYLYIYVYV